MKKILFTTTIILCFSIAATAQNNIIKIDTLIHPSKPIGKINPDEDSTIAKTKKGFNVKQSKVDNMAYLNANEDNSALKNKMPIGGISKPVEPMPVRKLPHIKDYSKRDTSSPIYSGSDSLRAWKKH